MFQVSITVEDSETEVAQAFGRHNHTSWHQVDLMLWKHEIPNLSFFAH